MLSVVDTHTYTFTHTHKHTHTHTYTHTHTHIFSVCVYSETGRRRGRETRERESGDSGSVNGRERECVRERAGEVACERGDRVQVRAKERSVQVCSCCEKWCQ